MKQNMNKAIGARRQLGIIWALLRRDIYVLIKKRLVDDVINNIIILMSWHLIFTHLSIAMGIAPSKYPAMLIGILSANILYNSWTIANHYMFDLEFDRLIDYYLTLPLSFNALLIQQIARYIIEITATSIPVWAVSYLLVSAYITPSFVQVLLFITMHIIATVFLAIFLNTAIFWGSFDWIRYNIWQRILWPMVSMGSIFYTWDAIVQFWPALGYILLLNPITYVSQGLRAALLPSTSPAIFWCAITLIALIIPMSMALRFCAHKRCNPVI